MGKLVYDVNLATAGVSTTSATPLTEVDHVFMKPGTRNLRVGRIDIGGRAAGLVAISGITVRGLTWATASTGGTAITPRPRDPGFQAAKATAASLPSAGATRVNRMSIECSASGPGNWFAWDQDHEMVLEGSGAFSFDLMSASGTASMLFEWSVEMAE